MDGQRFDDLTRAAAGVSRRRALLRIGGGLAGGALAALGLGRAAVRGQDEPASPPCSTCQRCVSMFVGRCVWSCVGSGEFEPETCANACCEGAHSVCTVLGECAATCAAPCPPA